jgi:hypothetical protein
MPCADLAVAAGAFGRPAPPSPPPRWQRLGQCGPSGATEIQTPDAPCGESQKRQWNHPFLIRKIFYGNPALTRYQRIQPAVRCQPRPTFDPHGRVDGDNLLGTYGDARQAIAGCLSCRVRPSRCRLTSSPQASQRRFPGKTDCPQLPISLDFINRNAADLSRTGLYDEQHEGAGLLVDADRMDEDEGPRHAEEQIEHDEAHAPGAQVGGGARRLVEKFPDSRMMTR